MPRMRQTGIAPQRMTQSMPGRMNVGVTVNRSRRSNAVRTNAGAGIEASIPISSVAFTTGKIPIPEDIARQISLDAAARVRAAAPKSPGAGPHSFALIRPTWRRNEVGVHIPQEAIHLFYLDQGIAPRVMWELQGKTIPIRLPGGQTIFRKATNVGQRVLTRDETGRITGSKIAWRHPGVPAMDFIMPNIEAAIRAWWERTRRNPQLVSELLDRYMSEAPGRRGV